MEVRLRNRFEDSNAQLKTKTKNEIQTHNYLIPKQRLNTLATVVKKLRCFVRTFLYIAFYCMLFSWQVPVS